MAGHAIGFESVKAPVPEAACAVSGRLPRWLAGRFIHSGPAQFHVGDEEFRHWFDGLAMLSSVELDGERAGYRSRYLQSTTRERDLARGRIAVGEFDTLPERGPWGRIATVLRGLDGGDNCNVNVADYGGHFVALTESARELEFDPRTLETLGELAHDDDVGGELATPHPHVDAERGSITNLVVRFGRASEYVIHEMTRGETKRRVLAALPADRPSYMHSFGASREHFVVVEVPLATHPLRMRFSARPYIERYRWDPERGTRIRVARKSDGEVVADRQLPPFFLFHHVNAVDRDGAVDVDLVVYPDASTVFEFRLAKLRSSEPPRGTGELRRITVPLSAERAIETRRLADAALELPRIAPAFEGREHRFVYGVGNEDRSTFFDCLRRVDARDGTTATFARPGVFPNEPVFVPAPGASGEDEGVLLSLAVDANEEVSRMLVLDAATLALRAEVRLPQVVPFHFHGQFFADAS